MQKHTIFDIGDYFWAQLNIWGKLTTVFWCDSFSLVNPIYYMRQSSFRENNFVVILVARARNIFDAPRNTDFQELACWENMKVPILGNLLPCLLASQIFCQDGCWVNIWSAPLVESNPWFLDEKTLVLPSTTCWAKLHIFICQDCLLIKQIWVSFLSSYYLLQNTVMSNNFGLYFLANVYLPGKTARMLLYFFRSFPWLSKPISKFLNIFKNLPNWRTDKEIYKYYRTGSSNN